MYTFVLLLSRNSFSMLERRKSAATSFLNLCIRKLKKEEHNY